MIKRKAVLWTSFLAAIFLILIFCLSFVTYRATVTVGGRTFSVEVAETQYLLEKGLSGHAPLSDSEGMLFVFSQPDNYGFWMKDMLFPLDIIWIDQDFKVVHIEKALSPETYPKIFYPGALSKYVLEINSGLSDKLDINIGDEVKFQKKWF